MSICYIYQDQYPWDIRIDKIVTSLSENGYNIHIVSKNKDGLSTKEEIFPNINVHRLPKCRNRFFRNIVNFPAFFSPVWLFKILEVIQRYNVRVIIVRDLPLSPLAVIVGRANRVPVIMDMAENYPAMIQDTWRFRGPKPQDYLIRNPLFLRLMESWTIKHLSGVIVVSKESKERILSLRGISLPVWVVGNTPMLERSKDIVPHPVITYINRKKGLKLLYVGGLESSRGLDIVLKSIRILVENGLDIFFIVVGDGESKDKLADLSSKYGIRKYIYFTGYMDHKYVPTIIKSADICIIPHYVTEHTNTTIPNKIFDYMAQGKPVIATHAKTLNAIISDHQCGIIYRDDDPVALATAIQKLSDPHVRKTFGESGYDMVNAKYNWNVEKRVLMEAIKYFHK